MIPHRLVRTVPEHTTDEVEGWWDGARALHPGWDFVTHRDPINENAFPITAPHWERCVHPAQMAGLIRLEEIWHHGGIYIDSDVECYRTFAPLLKVKMFAGWEDARCVPDAVFGAEPEHEAVGQLLALAIERLEYGPVSHRPWQSGPGVFTELLPGRDDVLLLPPGSLYPYHYSKKTQLRGRDHKTEQPWAFCAHHWHASWVPA